MAKGHSINDEIKEQKKEIQGAFLIRKVPVHMGILQTYYSRCNCCNSCYSLIHTCIYTKQL